MESLVHLLVHLHHFQVNHFLRMICDSFCLVTKLYSAVLCDVSVDNNNGTLTFNGTVIGVVATYTCDLGFELIGNATMTYTLVDVDSAEFQPV